MVKPGSRTMVMACHLPRRTRRLNPADGSYRGTYLARKSPKLDGLDRFDVAGAELAPDVDDDGAQRTPSRMSIRNARSVHALKVEVFQILEDGYPCGHKLKMSLSE